MNTQDAVRSAGLRGKQPRFVEEYLVDLNATQAAIRAGYSPRRASEIGYELLQKTTVQAAISAKQRERSARTGVTADRVMKEIARIAFADPRAVMSWGPDGVALRNSSDLSDDEAAAVAEVSDSGGGSRKVKMHDKVAALEKLARHIGLYDSETSTVVTIERSYAR